MHRLTELWPIPLRNLRTICGLMLIVAAAWRCCWHAAATRKPRAVPAPTTRIPRRRSSSSSSRATAEAEDEDEDSPRPTRTRASSSGLVATRGPSPTPGPTDTPEPTATPEATATPVPAESWVLTQANPMQRAAYEGSAADVEGYLNEGADITAGAGIRNAALDQQWNGLTPLHLAAAFNSDLDVAKLLLEWGANLDQGASSGGDTPALGRRLES